LIKSLCLPNSSSSFLLPKSSDNLSQLCLSRADELDSAKSQLAVTSKQSQKQLNQKKKEIVNLQAKCDELVDKV
jgi:hypothetical protein